MAQHVYVENYGNTEYSETFREKTITLQPGEKIKMQRREAIAFISQMSKPGLVDDNGAIDYTLPSEKRLRMIVIEKDSKGRDKDEEYVCNYDGKKFDNQKALDEYLEKMKGKTVVRDDDGVLRKAS